MDATALADAGDAINRRVRRTRRAIRPPRLFPCSRL